ncbi:MAG TPA: hypothetical protein ENF17_04775 [Candidatus Aminicenantes bacterium]|nr:hypothetical protein [Candidatus Aminicenantes bacterium]
MFLPLIIVIWQDRGRKLSTLPGRVAIIILLCFSIVQAIRAPTIVSGIYGARAQLHFIALYIFGYLWRVDVVYLRRLIWISTLSLLGVIVGIIYSNLVSASVYESSEYIKWATAVYGKEHIIGISYPSCAVVLVVLGGLSGALFLWGKGKIHRLGLIFFGGCLLGSILTINRGGILGFMMSFIFTMLITWRLFKRSKVFTSRVALASVAIIIILIVASFEMPGYYKWALTTFDAWKRARVAGPEAVRNASLQQILFGDGIGVWGGRGYTKYSQGVFESKWVDNVYVELLLCGGIFLPFLHLCVILTICKRLIQRSTILRSNGVIDCLDGGLVSSVLGLWCVILLIAWGGPGWFDYPGAMFIWLFSGITLRRLEKVVAFKST